MRPHRWHSLPSGLAPARAAARVSDASWGREAIRACIACRPSRQASVGAREVTGILKSGGAGAGTNRPTRPWGDASGEVSRLEGSDRQA